MYDFVHICRYVLKIDELIQKHADYALIDEGDDDENGLTNQHPPSYLKNQIWQLIISNDLYDIVIKFLLKHISRDDEQLIKYLLQTDVRGEFFDDIKIKNIVSLDEDLFQYILTYLSNDDAASVQQTTTVSYPPLRYEMISTSSYAKSFSVLDFDRKSLSDFIARVGKRLFTAKLVYSYHLFEFKVLLELQLYLKKQIKTQTDNKLLQTNNTDAKPSLTKPESEAAPAQDFSRFATIFHGLALYRLCEYLQCPYILKLGCLNRYWYYKIFDINFLHKCGTSLSLEISGQMIRNYNKLYSSHWGFANTKLLQMFATMVDITASGYPYLSLKHIQILQCNIIHMQKFCLSLRVLHVKPQNKRRGISLAFKPLSVWQHKLKLLVIENDRYDNVPQYNFAHKILWLDSIVSCESIIAAFHNPRVWWICLQNCQNSLSFELIETPDSFARENTVATGKTVFVCIDSSTWTNLELIFSVGIGAYKNFVTHVFIKQNYNTVDYHLRSFLDTLINVGTENVSKEIILLFNYDGTVQIIHDIDGQAQAGPEELIFSWCRDHAAEVFYNEKIKCFIFGITVDDEPQKSLTFDLKKLNDQRQIRKEYVLWAKMLYMDNFVPRSAPGLWQQYWNQMCQVSASTECPIKL